MQAYWSVQLQFMGMLVVLDAHFLHSLLGKPLFL